MGWCDDLNNPKKYNKLIKTSKKIKYEKLKRKDDKYNLLIPIISYQKFNYVNLHIKLNIIQYLFPYKINKY